VLGDRWVLLILREAFLGVDRFDAFLERLGISRATLTARLVWMVDAGVLERVPADAKYARYRLTEAGRALGPVVEAVRDWGEAHLPRAS
jgi:DNA-binding HxlR family transcriptional regulator